MNGWLIVALATGVPFVGGIIGLAVKAAFYVGKKLGNIEARIVGLETNMKSVLRELRTLNGKDPESDGEGKEEG